MNDRDRTPIRLEYERSMRNTDLDPQIVWRGKDEQDWSNLVVTAPPIFIQEKVHPKAIINDLIRQSQRNEEERQTQGQADLFADFNGLDDPSMRSDYYNHEQNWSNRMILGDSLQVMASLAGREGYQGKVQCIYIDPPYGIRFNSNFQWSTTSRDVRDGNAAHITREPEQVKAFRDTWRDGIHSYLTYLRDRLTVARDLLSDSGSVFVQIGDENVHRVRVVMDEVFGDENFVSLISIQTTTGFQSEFVGNISDYVLWYAKRRETGKSRNPYFRKNFQIGEGNARWLRFRDFTYRGVTASERRAGEIPDGTKPYAPDNLISQGRSRSPQPFTFQNKAYDPWEKNSHWKANYPAGMERLAKAGRLHTAENSIRFVRYHEDFELAVHGNIWTDTTTGNFTDDKTYVVQTNSKVIERCILMSTDPGDLGPRPYLRLRHHRLRRRAVGAPLDHHRHLPGCPGLGPRPHHGRPIPLLPAGRQPRRTDQGGRDFPPPTAQHTHIRQSATGLRLRAGAPHHAQGHRQQHRDRHHPTKTSRKNWSPCERHSTKLSKRCGKSGKFPEKPTSPGPRRPRPCTNNGGTSAPLARKR